MAGKMIFRCVIATNFDGGVPSGSSGRRASRRATVSDHFCKWPSEDIGMASASSRSFWPYWSSRAFISAAILPSARLTRRIIDMWMARKQQEIAEREGISEEAVRQITQEIPNLEKLGKADKALAEDAVDFDPADL
jgi:hypothetical protein